MHCRSAQHFRAALRYLGYFGLLKDKRGMLQFHLILFRFLCNSPQDDQKRHQLDIIGLYLGELQLDVPYFLMFTFTKYIQLKHASA